MNASPPTSSASRRQVHVPPSPRPSKWKRPAIYAVALGLGVLTGFLSGCNRGRHESIEGTVKEADVCMPPIAPPPADDCPACSSSEGGACRDRFYSNLFRCEPGTPSDSACQALGGACDVGLCVVQDRDGNGLDDDFEREVAERNLPAIHRHPYEACGGPRGIVYRVRRHPLAPSRLAVTYVVLYQRDCGALNGHVGDNEGFAITVDLGARPGAPATVGIVTDAHRHTACESVSSCQTAPGTSACAPPGEARAVVYASRDKHALYLARDVCESNCFDECAAGPVDPAPRLVDVGQPDAPLVSDLSGAGASGLVTASLGWDAALQHFNPWSSGTFGGAGHVRDQLLTLIAPPGL